MTTDVALGRLLVGDNERRRRQADEDAAAQAGEVLRTAFVIRSGLVLTAWHNVRRAGAQPIWFRVPFGRGRSTRFEYLPLTIVAKDDDADIALLGLDESRLGSHDRTVRDAWARLQEDALGIVADVRDRDPVKVIGFPTSARVSHPTSLAGEVVETRLRIGPAVAVKVQLPEVQASTPVDPHGLSGAPVLLTRTTTEEDARPVALGLVRAVPREPDIAGTPGGTVVVTAFRDLRHLAAIDTELARSPARPRRPAAGRFLATAAAVLALGVAGAWVVTSLRTDATGSAAGSSTSGPSTEGVSATAWPSSPAVSAPATPTRASPDTEVRFLTVGPLLKGASYAQVSGQDMRLTCGTNQSDDNERLVEFTLPPVEFTTFDAALQVPKDWGPDQGVKATVYIGKRYNGAERTEPVGSATSRSGDTSPLRADVTTATRVWIQYFCTRADATFTLQRPRLSR